MKVCTPQIAFHQTDGGKNDPVLSLDAHPAQSVIATAGSDKEVKIWLLNKEQEIPFNFLVSIVAHSKSVNGVRFSPNGVMLASCSDGGKICIMECNSEVQNGRNLLEDQSTSGSKSKPDSIEPQFRWKYVREEREISRRFLRGHCEDVVDIAWSADSKLLISGAVDGTVILWDVESGKAISTYEEHGHFVQGVAWDPYQHFFCSESADRTVKLFKLKLKTKPIRKEKKKNAEDSDSAPSQQQAGAVDTDAPSREYQFFSDLSKRHYTTSEAVEPDAAEGNGAETAPKPSIKKKSRMLFLDDSVCTFYRRPAWSPDGSILVLPTGQYTTKGNGPQPTTFVFLRGSWQSPALHLPGCHKTSVAVRFSQVLYNLRKEGPTPWLNLPYRMVFAVATQDSVYIYDTQHLHPIGIAEHLHLAQITDVAWCDNGTDFVVSSNDGYCSVFSAGSDELGTTFKHRFECPVFKPDLPESVPLPPLTPTKPAKEIASSSSATTPDDTHGQVNREPSNKRIRRITPMLVETTAPVPATPSEDSKGSIPEAQTPSITQSKETTSPAISRAPVEKKRKIRPEVIAHFESPQKPKCNSILNYAKRIEPIRVSPEEQQREQVQPSKGVEREVVDVEESSVRGTEHGAAEPKKKRRIQLQSITCLD